MNFYSPNLNIKSIIKIMSSLLILIFFFPCLISSEQCPKEKPIKKDNGNCSLIYCNSIEYANNECVISNSDVKKQWLSKIIYFGSTDEAELFGSVIINKNNTILISTPSYGSFNTRIKYLYHLSFDNSSFFSDKNGDKIIETQVEGSEFIERTFFNSISVNINNKNYILFCDPSSCDLIDYQNNIVTNNTIKNIFNTTDFGTASFSQILIELNKNNSYLYSLLTKNNLYYFEFYFNDNSIDSIIIDKQKVFQVDNDPLYTTSCFQTNKNMILCSKMSAKNGFIVIVFDENLEEKNQILIGTTENSNYYFSSLHLRDEIGVFFYIKSENECPILTIKELNQNENGDYLLTSLLNEDLKITSNINEELDFYLPNFLYNFNFIKINDEKIAYSHLNRKNNCFIFAIIDFYDETFSNIIIRYYKIYSSLYNLSPVMHKLFMYNNYIGAGSDTVSIDPRKQLQTTALIFGIIDPKNFSENEINNIENYSLKFNESLFEIPNNLFGYELYGVKILKFPQNLTGIKYLTKSNKREIKENDILNINEEIIFAITKIDVSINDEFSIEFGGVAIELNYSSSLSFPDRVQIIGTDPEKYYKRELFIGHNANFIFNFGCYKRCETCLNIGISIDDQKCITCKNTYFLDVDSKNCVKNCSEINKYDFIFNNKHLCLSIFQFLNPDTGEIIPLFLEKETNYLYENCNLTTNNKITYGNLCIRELPKNNSDKEILVEEIYENIKNQLIDKNYVIKENNTVILTEEVIIELSTLKNQAKYNSNFSIVSLEECEKTLKKIYGIDEKEDLIILKMESFSNDSESRLIQYELYNPTDLSKLDLNYCSGMNVEIISPTKLTNKTQSLYEELNDYGYNLFDLNDDFYNDICIPYTSENGTDLTLESRQKNLYVSLCQTGCVFNSFDSSSKKVSCNCVPQVEESKIKFASSFLYRSFFSSLKASNFLVLKCYKFLFKFNTKYLNIGRIIMTVLLITFLIITIICCFQKDNQLLFLVYNLIKANFILNKKKQKKNNNSNIVNEDKTENKNYLVNFNNIIVNEINEDEIKSNSKINNISNPPIKKNENAINIEINKDNNKKQVIYTNISNNLFILNNINKKKRKKHNKKYFEISNSNSNNKNINSINNNNMNIVYKEKTKNPNIKQNSKTKKNKQNNSDNPSLDKFKIYNNYELDNLSYKDAIKHDKRSYCEYYFGLLIQNQLLLFTFYPQHDYNLKLIKLSLFILSFTLYFNVNAFFFTDSTMNKISMDNGKYNILSRLPNIIYSSLITSIINIIIRKLSLSEKNILSIKQEKNLESVKNKSRGIIRLFKIKFIIFFIISLVIMLFCWYYIICFCAVYRNTQSILIIDTVESFVLSMVYPFGTKLLSGLFRIPALEEKDKECKFKIGKLLALV